MLMTTTTTVVVTSPTGPKSSNNNTQDGLAFVPPFPTAVESVTQEARDMAHVTDSLNRRTGMPTSHSAPPYDPAEGFPSARGFTTPSTLTEATVLTTVNTDDPQELTTIIPAREDVSVSLRVGVALPMEVDTVVPLDEVDSVTLQDALGSTTASDASRGVTTSASSTEVREDTKGSNPVTLVEGRVLTRPEQLVKCLCGSQEILTPTGCQTSQNDTSVLMGESKDIKCLTSLAELDVVVHDLHCDLEDDHRQMNFTWEKFSLRKRGDVILLDEAGALEGLRINNYCVTHLLDEVGALTWMMKACIPPPTVPTCCPPGQALKEGVCHPARTPDLLTPPMSATPTKGAVDWPVIRNHHNPITCTIDTLTSFAITTDASDLIALPTGIMHARKAAGKGSSNIYTDSSKFCVDAQQSLDGSVKYSANLCYSNPEERHHKICGGSTCVRKCCEFGEVMLTNTGMCAASNTNFEPHFSTTPPQYKTVTGRPLCSEYTHIGDAEGISINENGYLLYKGKTFPPTDYCVDIFSDNKDKRNFSGLACLSMISPWDNARLTVFPICHGISLMFLSLTVVCYCLVPVLLQNGGWYQLCHVLSLMVAYSSACVQTLFAKVVDTPTCIAMGLVMQFGFLATFFWLSVLCFEVWRKIRSLIRYRSPTAIPAWVYLLYAFGWPSIIVVITILMQYFAPDDVPGVIKPKMGVNSCWFPSDIEVFIYFYGPIAFLFTCNIIFNVHTIWNYRKIENNTTILKNITDSQSGEGCDQARRNPLAHRHHKRDHVSEFKQQFLLLVLMASCWVAEVLSWKISPSEMWALTDILNNLQGFFIFVIFMANRSKRRHISEKFPKLSKAGNRLKSAFQKIKSAIPCGDATLGRMVTRVNGVISASSFVSNLSTMSTRLPSTSSSFNVNSTKDKARRSSSGNESEDGVVTLSHSQLCSSSSNDSVFCTSC